MRSTNTILYRIKFRNLLYIHTTQRRLPRSPHIILIPINPQPISISHQSISKLPHPQNNLFILLQILSKIKQTISIQNIIRNHNLKQRQHPFRLIHILTRNTPLHIPLILPIRVNLILLQIKRLNQMLPMIRNKVNHRTLIRMFLNTLQKPLQMLIHKLNHFRSQLMRISKLHKNRLLFPLISIHKLLRILHHISCRIIPIQTPPRNTRRPLSHIIIVIRINIHRVPNSELMIRRILIKVLLNRHILLSKKALRSTSVHHLRSHIPCISKLIHHIRNLLFFAEFPSFFLQILINFFISVVKLHLKSVIIRLFINRMEPVEFINLLLS